MIDIIIPAYNAHKTIISTLASIAVQTISHLTNIYIIDDCSQKNYNNEVKKFNELLNIKLIRNDKNVGPGMSRQIGMEMSNSQYIIFMDADDQFYNNYSLELLYDTIRNERVDAVVANEYRQKENSICAPFGSLHSQIFSRTHIESENIKFNSTKSSEDTYFEQVFLSTCKKFIKIDEICYTYLNNCESITNNNSDDLFARNFLKNMSDAIEDSVNRNANIEYIREMIVFTFVYLNMVGFKDKTIYKQGKKLINFYNKYKEYIDDDYIVEMVVSRKLIKSQDIVKNFKDFLERFEVQ